MKSVLTLSVFLIAAASAHAIEIELVPVGNAGNAPDTRYMNISVGSVGYDYQIGKYEITAGQYTEFLNAVAKADPYELYNPNLAITYQLRGAGIKRSGSSPNFSYSLSAEAANRPVNYVSFWDAARFANWLHNGQPVGPEGSGTTEDGSYHDVGNQALFGRNAGATFVIPTEDEWYKAAYHDKTVGLSSTYFDYPTRTNAVPGRDTNETTNAGNNANYLTFDYLIGNPFYRTEVGEFELSESPYGTFDEGGNVTEWNETAVNDSSRGARVGHFGTPSIAMNASFGGFADPTGEGPGLGFRVARIPEPSTTTLAVISAIAGYFFFRRRITAR